MFSKEFEEFCRKYPGFSRKYAYRRFLGMGRTIVLCGYMDRMPEYDTYLKVYGKRVKAKLLDIRETTTRPVLNKCELIPNYYFYELVH